MHTTAPSKPADRRRQAGFSLPEVAMAIGIIAIAFVALISLLPVGLNGLRSSMDRSNEMWIMQGINSMVQTTEWERVWNAKTRTSEITKDIYYFDEEGRMTDTEKNPGSSVAQRTRLYRVKLFVEPLARPMSSGNEFIETTTPGANDGKLNEVSVKVVSVMATLSNAAAMTAFDEVVDLETVRQLPKTTPLLVSSFVVSQLNAYR